MSDDAPDTRASMTADAFGPPPPANEDTAQDAKDADVPDVPDAHVPRSRASRTQIRTVRLDPRDVRPSWPTAIATLEQLSTWSVLALRLGALALIQQCVRELAQEEASASSIVRLRELVDAIAHMPLES